MTIREICNNAADLIDLKGWCRYHLTENGRFDLLGAINEAADESSYHLTTTHISQVLGSHNLAVWNDRQESKKPVIALLRKAARTPLTGKNEISSPPSSAS